jgi:hypothetical protein
MVTKIGEGSMAKRGKRSKYWRAMTDAEKQAESRARRAGKPLPKFPDPPKKRDWSRWPRLKVKILVEDADELDRRNVFRVDHHPPLYFPALWELIAPLIGPLSPE